MTQKKIGNDLYVFKQEAYEITADTDATNIYVQLELIDAFKTANASLASKIKPINYNLLQVTKPVYADYINADDPTGEAEPTGESGETGATGDTGETGGSTAEIVTGEAEPTGESGESGTGEGA